MMAKAYGMYSEGPIDNPNDLGPAIKRAIEVVKKGEPAMIDVVTQPEVIDEATPFRCASSQPQH